MVGNEGWSSVMKAWVHHTLAVVAAALAMKGRARVPAAANPKDPWSTERRLSLRMAILPCSRLAARDLSRLTFCLFAETSGARPPHGSGAPTPSTEAGLAPFFCLFDAILTQRVTQPCTEVACS